jgi:P-loop Domain of unknown function (DUF2791)
MTKMSQRDLEHIFERRRSGVVPERGLEAFAVGMAAGEDLLSSCLLY